MPGVGFRTADNGNPQVYPFTTVSEPGTYEVRGTVAAGDFTWNPKNFAGFLKRHKETIWELKTLTTAITEGNKLTGDSPYGVTYQTAAQRKKGLQVRGLGLLQHHGIPG